MKQQSKDLETQILALSILAQIKSLAEKNSRKLAIIRTMGPK